jgi:hypothetical protein
MCLDALVAQDVDMHPELSSLVAQSRFHELGTRVRRASRYAVASDVGLPPPRKRDPVGRDREIA